MAVMTSTGVKTRRLADRVAEMTSFKVVDFLEAAERLQAEGRDIVRLEAGQPAFATPQLIVEAAEAALRDEKKPNTLRRSASPNCAGLSRTYIDSAMALR